MLMTWALWLAAQRMPLAMFRAVPKPSESSTRTGMIFAREARPVRPKWLPVRSAIVPVDVGAVAVLVERHAVLVDEVVAGEELLAREVRAAPEPGLLGPVRDAGVEHRHPRALARRDAALLEDVPGPRGVEPAALLELERGGGLAAERPAGQEVPLGPLPAAGDAGGARVVRDGRGVGDVVRHRVGHRRVGVEGPLGGGHVHAPGQLQRGARASVEAHEQLARDVAGCRGASAAAATPAAEARSQQDKRGCGDQLSHGPRCIFPEECRWLGRLGPKHRPDGKFLIRGSRAGSRDTPLVADSDRRADDAARAAARQGGGAKHGDVPIGAVVARGDEVLGEAGNERELRGDPTAHAEVLALRQASERLGGWRLLETTIYVTLEPCPMCAGAITLARVPRLVYGAADPKGGAVGRRDRPLRRAGRQPPPLGRGRPARGGIGRGCSRSSSRRGASFGRRASGRLGERLGVAHRIGRLLARAAQRNR